MRKLQRYKLCRCLLFFDCYKQINLITIHYIFFLVIGALIGKQKGRNIEVMNSFELVFSVIGGDIVIDKDYYNMKEEQCK